MVRANLHASHRLTATRSSPLFAPREVLTQRATGAAVGRTTSPLRWDSPPSGKPGTHHPGVDATLHDRRSTPTFTHQRAVRPASCAPRSDRTSPHLCLCGTCRCRSSSSVVTRMPVRLDPTGDRTSGARFDHVDRDAADLGCSQSSSTNGADPDHQIRPEAVHRQGSGTQVLRSANDSSVAMSNRYPSEKTDLTVAEFGGRVPWC